MRRKPSIDHVPFSSMTIDDTYQRAIVRPRVRHLVTGWNFDRMGIMTLSLREDGRYYVIDGQHRKLAAMELGYGSTKARCHIYKGLTREQEAELFLALNDTRPVTPMDKFKAGLAAGDEVCLTAQKVLASHGLRVSSSEGDGAVRCVGRVVNMAERDPKLLDETCKVLTEAWGTRAAAFDQVVFSGIAAVLDRYNGELDRSRFTQKLAKYRGGPAALAGDAGGLADYKPISKTRAVGEIAVDNYNKGATKNRLPQF